MNIKFTEFHADKHCQPLYELLKQRSHKISHNSLPSYIEHHAFCSKHPYRKWLMIYENDELIGSVYLTFTNAIGINIRKAKQEHYEETLKFIEASFEPLAEKASVIPAYFHVNVPPSNKLLASTLQERRAPLIQCTYKI